MFESRCRCKKVIVHYGECSVTNEYRETRREVFVSSLLFNSKLEGTSARKTLSETDETKATAPANIWSLVRLPLTFEASSGSSSVFVTFGSLFGCSWFTAGTVECCFFRVEDAAWKKTSL